MKELKIRFVKIEPIRVACTHAHGVSPEPEAWKAMEDWAGPKGLLSDPADFYLFGRNDPSPSKEGEPYGYRFMISVGPEVKQEGTVNIEEIPGGLYAVTRTQGVYTLPNAWMNLYNWCKKNRHKITGHGLEEHLTPHEKSFDKLLFDLWMPIEE